MVLKVFRVFKQARVGSQVAVRLHVPAPGTDAVRHHDPVPAACDGGVVPARGGAPALPAAVGCDFGSWLYSWYHHSI